jgi:hypothetical protein
MSVEKQCHATKYLQAKNPVENKIHRMCIFTIQVCKITVLALLVAMADDIHDSSRLIYEL